MASGLRRAIFHPRHAAAPLPTSLLLCAVSLKIDRFGEVLVRVSNKPLLIDAPHKATSQDER
eukprot:scaffold1240_cov101-Isochrysis_galbana.AAC.1